MPQSRPLLEITAVEAVYDHAIVALHEVSLQVREGEILALLGANGAGKTTTLKALSNLLPAERGAITKGEIRFLDLDVKQTKPSNLVRRGLVQVLEGRHCFRSLTVEENLITGALGRSSSRREAAADLERVYAYFPRLKEKRKAKSGLTSGGEQQMTAIGRALMSRPRLLVLDEPSMGLAPLIVQNIFKILKRLNREKGFRSCSPNRTRPSRCNTPIAQPFSRTEYPSSKAMPASCGSGKISAPSISAQASRRRETRCLLWPPRAATTFSQRRNCHDDCRESKGRKACRSPRPAAPATSRSRHPFGARSGRSRPDTGERFRRQRLGA